MACDGSCEEEAGVVSRTCVEAGVDVIETGVVSITCFSALFFNKKCLAAALSHAL